MKTTRFPALRKPEGAELLAPGLRSASMKVPAAVPSVTQGSLPFTPSVPEKRIRTLWAPE